MKDKMKTWTGLEDIPDPDPRPCTIEQEQEDYLIDRLGLRIWGELCQMEMEAEHE